MHVWVVPISGGTLQTGLGWHHVFEASRFGGREHAVQPQATHDWLMCDVMSGCVLLWIPLAMRLRKAFRDNIHEDDGHRLSRPALNIYIYMMAACPILTAF